MTREEYVNYRNNNVIDYMYYFYTEYKHKSKSTQNLNKEEFLNYFIMWSANMFAINNVVQYYDVYFNILKINTGKQEIYV